MTELYGMFSAALPVPAEALDSDRAAWYRDERCWNCELFVPAWGKQPFAPWQMWKDTENALTEPGARMVY